MHIGWAKVFITLRVMRFGHAERDDYFPSSLPVSGIRPLG
jgi:hypothetical protein